jgi:hypothetical protein
MKLRWEKRHSDLHLGFSPIHPGQEVAQVAHVHGPDGSDHGWMVWLTVEQGELFDRYNRAGDAMKAAEARVAPP